MQVTVKELRIQPGKFISMARSGNEVIVTMRGKPAAKIVPITTREESAPKILSEAFGMWKDREDMEDVSAYMSDLRKGRQHDY
jgi:prevent-host-death family protein